MPINKKLIHFNTKQNFLSNNGIGTATSPTNGNYGNIPETSIVFIKDTQEIWTHGQFYSQRDIPVWDGTKVMYKSNIFPDYGLLYVEHDQEKGEWSFQGITLNNDDHCFHLGNPNGNNLVTVNVRILEDLPSRSFVSYTRRDDSIIITEVLSSDSIIQKLFDTLNWVKSDIDGLVYQIHSENGDITPLSHPDLSTQPSILPQRFGKYNIKEVLLPIRHEGGVSPRTNEIVEDYDSGYMSFLKDNNYVNGNIIEISLFGDGYCTHPTVKLINGAYFIFPTLPQGEWANLDFALIRYMVPGNNYYDAYSEPYNNYQATRILHDDGTYVLKYSTQPNYSANSNRVSESGMNDGQNDTLILIYNNSITPQSISSSGHYFVYQMLSQMPHDKAYLAVQIGPSEYITHQMVDYYENSIVINEI